MPKPELSQIKCKLSVCQVCTKLSPGLKVGRGPNGTYQTFWCALHLYDDKNRFEEGMIKIAHYKHEKLWHAWPIPQACPFILEHTLSNE